MRGFRAIDRDTFEIRLERPAPAEIVPGDALENLTWSPDVTIRNNDFESNRARGLLVSTPGRVLIENNRFQSSGSAILIAGDANAWYESGAVRDVTIRGNVFGEACLSSPYQFGEGDHQHLPGDPRARIPRIPFHRNIRIEDNEFHPSDYPVLYAKSVDGLTFSGNRLIRSRLFEPVHRRKATLTFEACRRVRVERNQLGEDVLGRNIVLKDTPEGELSSARAGWGAEAGDGPRAGPVQGLSALGALADSLYLRGPHLALRWPCLGPVPREPERVPLPRPRRP